jgi:hypothetical protein
MLRAAQHLLDAEAEYLRRQMASQADLTDGSLAVRYRALLDSAADLNALAREIAAEVELA